MRNCDPDRETAVVVAAFVFGVNQETNKTLTSAASNKAMGKRRVTEYTLFYIWDHYSYKQGQFAFNVACMDAITSLAMCCTTFHIGA
jgi:hypothetical protein